jgi:hypothetical protein
VPKQFTDEHKWESVETCRQFLQKGETFLQWTVTGNEIWVHHHEPASKHQSMEWKHVITQDHEIQKCTFCQQSESDAVLGL